MVVVAVVVVFAMAIGYSNSGRSIVIVVVVVIVEMYGIIVVFVVADDIIVVVVVVVVVRDVHGRIVFVVAYSLSYNKQTKKNYQHHNKKESTIILFASPYALYRDG